MKRRCSLLQIPSQWTRRDIYRRGAKVGEKIQNYLNSLQFILPVSIKSFDTLLDANKRALLIITFILVNKSFQRRWFVLKGNLLFYFEKRGGELLGMIILEGCVIELAENELEKYCFNINFHGNRTYVLSADEQETLESWMKALTCSGFDYMRLMVSELQRQLEEIDKTSISSSSSSDHDKSIPPIPPRRLNPFNKNGKCVKFQ